ncbi:MAG: leucine-rich repeat domain-containing protein, partial [Metamycoplasmataceae bacterium]
MNLKANKKNILIGTLSTIGLASIITTGLVVNNNENQKSNNTLVAMTPNKNTRVTPITGTTLTKDNVTELEWNTKENISLADWSNLAPNVTVIGVDAFLNNHTLQSIQIPAKVTEIEEAAFFDTRVLNNVHFEEGSALTKIGTRGFAQAGMSIDELTINLPHSVNSFGTIVFRNSKIKTITIPDNVTVLATALFEYSSLENVIFTPNSRLTEISRSVFSNSRLQSIDIPYSITDIHDEAFMIAQRLNEIAIPRDFQGTPPGTPKYGFTQTQWDSIIWKVPPFMGTTLTRETIIELEWNNKTSISLNEWNVLARNVTAIAANAFEDLTLQSIEIPDRITSIGNEAFKNTTALSTITINPTSELESIGDNAFENSAITMIYIPESLTTIGDDAFKGLTALQASQVKMSVSLRKNSWTPLYGFTQEQWDAIDWLPIPFQGTTLNKEELFNIGWSTKTVITLNDWAEKAPNVTTIETGTFEGHTLTSIVVPKKVTTIKADAFKDTTSLTSITLPYALYLA